MTFTSQGNGASVQLRLSGIHEDCDVLVVDGRWRVELSWFVGFRLLSGFWGPPRGLELLSLRGEPRLLQGDPMGWVGRVTGAAPWLVELHDHGLLWPPLAWRLRRLALRSRESGS